MLIFTYVTINDIARLPIYTIICHYYTQKHIKNTLNMFQKHQNYEICDILCKM